MEHTKPHPDMAVSMLTNKGSQTASEDRRMPQHVNEPAHSTVGTAWASHRNYNFPSICKGSFLCILLTFFACFDAADCCFRCSGVAKQGSLACMLVKRLMNCSAGQSQPQDCSAKRQRDGDGGPSSGPSAALHCPAGCPCSVSLSHPPNAASSPDAPTLRRTTSRVRILEAVRGLGYSGRWRCRMQNVHNRDAEQMIWPTGGRHITALDA